LFAYPASTKPPKKETITKAVTAVLSTTARAKAREKKRAAAEGEAMDVVSPLSKKKLRFKVDSTPGNRMINLRQRPLKVMSK